MAVINKQWSNGDALTLTTSVGGIAVSSAQNTTGADRQMTVQVRTTNEGEKVTKSVTVRQLRQPVDTRGYWVHKDTNVKTYFDATADFIVNGVMHKPSWIADAKEIRLCAGITDFENYSTNKMFKDAYGITFDIITPDIYVSEILAFLIPVKQGDPTNNVLQKFDLGSASLVNFYSMFNSFTALTDVVLNDSVTKIFAGACIECSSLARITIPSSVQTIQNSTWHAYIGGGVQTAFTECPALMTVYTDIGNSTPLSTLLNGKGLPNGYQIIEQ